MKKTRPGEFWKKNRGKGRAVTKENNQKIPTQGKKKNQKRRFYRKGEKKIQRTPDPSRT